MTLDFDVGLAATALRIAVAIVFGGMAAILWIVACRLEKISLRTRRSVRAYFLTMGAGMVLAMVALLAPPLPPVVRLACSLAIVVASILTGLAISSHRWKESAPTDTTRPPMDEDTL